MKIINEISTDLYSPYGKLYLDYLLGKESVEQFYSIPLNEDEWGNCFQKIEFDESKRMLLHEILSQQNSKNPDSSTKENINLLKHKNTFTITTGHQLILLGGPLFFIYKVATVIAACKKLKAKHPDYNFVPVYWMASEDHDLEEINHTYINGKKYEWEISGKGRSGKLKTDGLKETLQIIFEQNATLFTEETKTILFEKLNSKSNYGEFFRLLVETIFKNTGLLIIDADEKKLKKEFIPFILKDLFENTSFNCVQNTNQKLKANAYALQVNPRNINLFYVKENFRERIEFDGQNYNVVNSDISFSKENLIKEVNNYPERFSPNVILRPLYQQIILPNFCYVGGPGELSYWLQYKENFEQQGLFFPLLLPRFSGLQIDTVSQQRLVKLKMDVKGLFRPATEALNEVLINEEFTNSFIILREELNATYNKLVQEAKNTDPTLEASAEGERKKAMDGVENIQKKITKAIRNKNESTVQSYLKLKEKFLPNGVLNERSENGFAETLKNPIYIQQLIALIESEGFESKSIKIIAE